MPTAARPWMGFLSSGIGRVGTGTPERSIMQKAKRVGRTVAASSPGECLTKCLEDWLGAKGDACLPDARDIEASDDAWDRRKIRVRAQQAIEELASERVQLACVAAGFAPIIKLVEQLPFDQPLPGRAIDHAQPATWRLHPRPMDELLTELRVDDPAQFLVTLVEGVVPAWIECLTAPIKPVARPMDAGVWMPAGFFPPKMRSRLRHASGKKRIGKRVRTKIVDRTTLYSVEDARRWWPQEVGAIA